MVNTDPRTMFLIKDIIQTKDQIEILTRTQIEITLVIEIMKRMILIQCNQEIITKIEITLIIIAIQMTHIIETEIIIFIRVKEMSTEVDNHQRKANIQNRRKSFQIWKFS